MKRKYILSFGAIVIWFVVGFLVRDMIAASSESFEQDGLTIVRRKCSIGFLDEATNATLDGEGGGFWSLTLNDPEIPTIGIQLLDADNSGTFESFGFSTSTWTNGNDGVGLRMRYVDDAKKVLALELSIVNSKTGYTFHYLDFDQNGIWDFRFINGAEDVRREESIVLDDCWWLVAQSIAWNETLAVSPTTESLVRCSFDGLKWHREGQSQ